MAAGAVLIDKPAGPTSHDVVARVRRALGIRAVGHTGTLDPFATGLLVVMVGRATRLARFIEGQPKTYLATAQLGVRTATDDRTGEIAGEAVDVGHLTETAVRDALAAFRGTSGQRPPSYSAKRIGGERSYRLARRGETVALAEVEVTVHEIELVAFTAPEVIFRATVSPSTYLRAIARDLGEQLGVGAHLVALRREAIGPLRVEEAVPLDLAGPDKVVPARRVLRHLPSVALSDAERRAVAYGQRVGRSDRAGDRAHEEVALVSGEDLVAIAVPRGGQWQPIVVLEGM